MIRAAPAAAPQHARTNTALRKAPPLSPHLAACSGRIGSLEVESCTLQAPLTQSAIQASSRSEEGVERGECATLATWLTLAARLDACPAGRYAVCGGPRRYAAAPKPRRGALRGTSTTYPSNALL
eukprot:scaffold9247_cov72-Phaeocystis_antarctica.AAC.1